MANITNIANISQYTYDVGTTTKTINTPITATVSNTFTDPQVTFTKTCTPTFADLNEVVTITYRVQNVDNTSGSPVISSILVTDPFLTESVPFIDITIGSNVTSYNQTAGTFNIFLPNGSLTPGNSVEATFTYIVSKGYNFTTSLTSTATAAFNLSPAGTLTNQFSSCGSTVNNGTLAVLKSVTPTTAVSSGSVLTYTISITNTGNVASTIPIRMFSDPIPAGSVFIANTISPVGHFVYDDTSNSIINADAITIPSNLIPYNITYSVRVL